MSQSVASTHKVPFPSRQAVRGFSLIKFIIKNAVLEEHLSYSAHIGRIKGMKTRFFFLKNLQLQDMYHTAMIWIARPESVWCIFVIVLVCAAAVSWPCALVQCRTRCAAFVMDRWGDNPEGGTTWTTAPPNLWKLLMKGKFSIHLSESGF